LAVTPEDAKQESQQTRTRRRRRSRVRRKSWRRVVWCWWCRQGRSRHRTITPVRGARPSDGPHFKVPRATPICRRLQGIASLRQSGPFRYMRTAMPACERAHHCPHWTLNNTQNECLAPSLAPAPASAVTAELIRAEVLSEPPGWALGHHSWQNLTRAQQMAERLKNDHGGIGCRALLAPPAHSRQQASPGGWRTCFESDQHLHLCNVGGTPQGHASYPSRTADDEAVLPQHRLTSRQRGLGRRL
jgi:hypothetical protein